MRTDKELVQDAIRGWEVIKRSGSRETLGRYKLGNRLAQKPLCDVYLQHQCRGCPVMRATSRVECHHTPFDKVRANIVDWVNRKTKKSYYLIDRQLQFLQELGVWEDRRSEVAELIRRGPVLSTTIQSMYGITPQKATWWMKGLGYRTSVARKPLTWQKIIYYEQGDAPPASFKAPGYRCERCKRLHAVKQETLMPFSLICAECGGQMHLTSVDASVNVSHRIAGITLKEFE